MKNIVITGGTGFIGSHLAEAMIEDNHVVTIIDIHEGHLKEMKDWEDFKFLQTDISNTKAMSQIMKDCDILIHCSALVSDWGPKAKFLQNNIIGTRNLFDLALKYAIPRVVLISSVGVYGSIKNPPASEEHPYGSRLGYYEWSKREMDKMAFEYYNTDNLPVTIIRPAIVYGPRDKFWPFLLKALKEGKLKIFGSGKHLMHLVYVKDVVEDIKLAAYKKNVEGEAFNISSEKITTVIENYQIVSELLHVQCPGKVPFSLAYTIASLLELGAKIKRSNEPPILTRYRLQLVTKHHAYDISKAKRILDYQPKYSVRDGMAETIDWCEAQQIF